MHTVHVYPCLTEVDKVAETVQVDIGASHLDMLTWRVEVTHTAVASRNHHHHLKATRLLYHPLPGDLPAGFTAELAVPFRPLVSA
jgi:hypothetical protein